MSSLKSIANLTRELSKLPGIGEKTAQRLAFYILKISRSDAEMLAKSIIEVKDKTKVCSICFNMTEGDPCEICQDESRNTRQICVVEEPHDQLAIEKTGIFRGRYHILQGSLAPLEDRGPDDIRMKELSERTRSGDIDEVIIATNPNNEGEATAIYIARALRNSGVKITRIAQGIPMGGDLEYADQVTVGKAIEGRKEV